MENILLYLLLTDILTHEYNTFPNQILSALLGVHISCWKLSCRELISLVFNDPECLKDETIWKNSPLLAKNFNAKKFKKIIEKSRNIENQEKENIVTDITEKIEEVTNRFAEKAFLEKENIDLKARVEELERKV